MALNEQLQMSNKLRNSYVHATTSQLPTALAVTDSANNKLTIQCNAQKKTKPNCSNNKENITGK